MACQRITQIMDDSRESGLHQPETHFRADMHEAALGPFAHLPLWEKAARSMAHAVVSQPVFIKPYDRIIGRVYHYNEKKAQRQDPDFDYASDVYRELCRNHEGFEELCQNKLIIGTSPACGHITWFWDKILRHGVTGLRDMAADSRSRTADARAAEFYSGVIIMLDALAAWNQRHVDALEEMGMEEMAEICRRVPQYPARTFHEAVQSFFMQYIVVMAENPYGGNGPGRLDYYLWPYLERDLRRGACTPEQARELIDELLIRIDERIHPGDTWVEAIVVGGTHPSGASAVNPLSHMLVESVMELNITHPSVYIRLPDDPPDDFVDLAARYFLSGSNRAQILGDSSVMDALTRSGVWYRDAAEYACGGCMEIGIQGMTSDFLYAGWFNVLKITELFTTGGLCLKTGRPIGGIRARGLAAYPSFEDFYGDYIEEMERLVGISHRAMDRYSQAIQDKRPGYLISSMIDDCLRRGRGMHAGGAKYHDYGSTPMGMPNAADYLYAVKRAVFDEGFCTAEELIEAMAADFRGHEKLQARLRAIPKYGQEDPGADAMAVRLMADIGRIYGKGRTRWGGRTKVVVLTFVWAPAAGAAMGATADGNHAGKPVAQGVTPQCSSMTGGITTAINSCLRLPFEVMNGGAATMWDFDAAWATGPVVKSVLKAFLLNGGQIFQGNATDVETLLKARENPEDYRHLIVRVGGFSARFVNLDSVLQDEIIARTRHSG